MNYQWHYDRLISTRKEREMEKGKHYEKHHILPRSMGGSDDESNLVYLTAREHFLAHWFLWRIHRNRKMALAFSMMKRSNSKQSRITSSRAYEEIRSALSETNKGNKYGKGHTKTMSEEWKRKHSEFMKGRFIKDKNSFYGKTHSDEAKKRISEKRKNRETGTYKGLRLVIKDDVILGEFKKTEDVANFIGCTVSKVKSALAKHIPSVDGYIIKYKNSI